MIHAWWKERSLVSQRLERSSNSASAKNSMARTNYEDLLNAGVHFGHLKRKWNPNMAPYIFMEKNGIHIIDLHKTVAKLEEAANALRQIASSGRKILFVATKKQAKDLVTKKVKSTGMPYVTERWPGGMLTNFSTIRKAVRKMDTIDKMSTDGTFENVSKKGHMERPHLVCKLVSCPTVTGPQGLPPAVDFVENPVQVAL